MKKTKERILDTALSMFNTQGLSKVTLRSIANEMGISQGNLNYHFKKRDDIIEGLYFQLVQLMDDSLSNIKPSDNLLQLLFEMSEAMMFNFYDFRFFLLDFVQIIRENATIRAHYLELIALREQQFTMIFEALMAKGFMQKPALPNEHHNLFLRFQILGNSWISSTVLLSENLSEKLVPKYLEMMNQTIYPYLTEKGKGEYVGLSGER